MIAWKPVSRLSTARTRALLARVEILDPHLEQLIDAARGGTPRREGTRGISRESKLRFDPVFIALLRRGLFPDEGTLLDLGCGQGLLLSLLLAAREPARGRPLAAGLARAAAAPRAARD